MTSRYSQRAYFSGLLAIVALPVLSLAQGALTVSPLTASLWKDGRQIIHLSSGAHGADFDATVLSDTGWLAIGLAGSSTAPGVTPLTGNVPDGGTRDLAITVISASVTANSHSGTVTIAGTGSASRTRIIVNVEYHNEYYDPYSQVKPIPIGDHEATQIRIDLQGTPNYMEPVAEPRRIRIDDRRAVRFLLTGLSPLDVCTPFTGTPAPTAEAPVGESFITTVAGLGAFSVSPKMPSPPTVSMMSDQENRIGTLLNVIAPSTLDRKVQNDPEYELISDRYTKLLSLASCLIDKNNSQNCKPAQKAQIEKSQSRTGFRHRRRHQENQRLRRTGFSQNRLHRF